MVVDDDFKFKPIIDHEVMVRLYIFWSINVRAWII